MNYLPQIKKIVDELYLAKDSAWVLPHFERTVDWYKRLKPEANEAELIAAYGHDIERAIPDSNKPDFKREETGFINKEAISYHQTRSAELLTEELRKLGADEAMRIKVYDLVDNHELGGTTEQDILQAADSISFLENNSEHFINVKLEERGYQTVKDKLDWMYERIKVKKAKKLAEPFYEKAMKMLEEKKPT